MGMSKTAVQHYRWSRTEYDRMIAAGVFDPRARVELIDGEIVNMVPQGSLHATALQLAEEQLRAVFAATHAVRVQMPLALDDASEPEPDLAVVVGGPRDYRDAHPSSAVLVVEVADTTLVFDREQKQRLYARAGIEEYWIVNLTARQLEVRRDPRGESYASSATLQTGDSVAPLAAPDRRIAVSDLLP